MTTDTETDSDVLSESLSESLLFIENVICTLFACKDVNLGDRLLFLEIVIYG